MKFNLAAVFTVVVSAAMVAESKLKPSGTYTLRLFMGKQQEFGLSIESKHDSFR